MLIPEHIENLIYQEERTPKEQEMLEHWVNENTDNKQAYIELCRVWCIGKYAGYWKEKKEKKAWVTIKRTAKKRRRNIVVRRITAIAALIALMLGGSWLGWKYIQKPFKELSSETILPQAGTSKALLVLSSGKQIQLGTRGYPEISEKGVTIHNDSAIIVYNAEEEESADREKFNELIVPVGGEYKLRLDDGTIIYLNSLSRLKYPVRFNNHIREVTLEGEAYFEVAHNKKRPFIVHTDKFRVSVLGTSFNIKSYPTDLTSEVTLVNGKVDVKVGQNSNRLKPSEQIVVDHKSQATSQWIVNVTDYIGWKDGYLNFKTIPFSQLAIRLGRWYNVDFIFLDEGVKDLKFSGAFRKYDDISYILSLIEKTSDVSFKINKNVILVNRR